MASHNIFLNNNNNNNNKCFLSSKSVYSMISEGSCDTEDWSNDAENSAFHHRNTVHLENILYRKQL